MIKFDAYDYAKLQVDRGRAVPHSRLGVRATAHVTRSTRCNLIWGRK